MLHFLLVSLTMLPIAYFCRWMEHSLLGFLGYFGIFVAIYAVLWLVLTQYWRHRVRSINQRLQGK